MSSPLVFLSHSSADTDAALAVARRLEDSPLGRQHGLEVWVDKRDLVPGPGWKKQLQDALDRSTAFAVYVGSKRIVNWVWDEVSVALDRAHESPGYPVIPILAAQARFDELPSFLSQYHGVSDVERDGEAFAALLRGLLALDARVPVEAEPEPFQGLEAFTSRRAHLFFGRESDTGELLDLVRTEPLVIVVGDSGSGKSSLVKAGLIPRFRGGGLADSSRSGVEPFDSSRTSNAETLWRVLESRPLSDPFEKLAEAVLAEAQAYGKSVKECSDLADLVRSRRASSIKDAIHLSGPTGATAKTLLVVDQFEELFTLADAPTQTAFADVLVALATPADAALRIVLTMRWDYYHLCSNTPALYARLEADKRRARYTLRRMSADRLRRCVTEPLRLAGVADAERETLATAVLTDVGERPNDLALLEMALQHAWAKRAKHSHDLLRTYVAIGRVDGALATAADEIVTTTILTPDEQSLVEPLFIRLVKLGDTGGATRRVASREELDGGRWELAQKLASKECYRLVVTTDDTVEIAHEAIVTSWPRYVAWLRNDRVTNDLRADDKRHLDALVDDARRWSAAPENERPLVLAHGFDLERYEALLGRRPSWLCERERSFIDTSTREHERAVEREQEAARERERAHQRERDDARTLRRRGYVAALLGGVASVMAVVALWYAYDARRQSEAARIASVVRTAASLADSDPTAAALVLTTFTADREPDGVLSVATRVAREPLATILRGHDYSVRAAVFSRDDTHFVTTGDDGAARVWRTDGTGDPVVLRGHAGPVVSAVFSPDGTHIVTAGWDGTARVWRADGAGDPVVLMGHSDRVNSAAFSPDGTHIVTAGWDSTARVWRADGAGTPVVLRGHNGAVVSAAFSPDNTRIVSASFDLTARVWHADGTGDPVVLRGHNLRVHSAAFSADSTHIVTSAEDGTARVWRADGTGDPVVLRAHDGPVFSAAFSPDDMRVVTAGGDGTARVWRPDASGDPVVLRGHSGPVRSAVFSLDSTRIVTVSDDGTARVWRADGSGDPVVLRGHIRPVLSADFSSDNIHIVTAGDDGTTRVWQARGATDPVVLRGHTDLVTSAVFSPDNARIATASWDHTVRVWRADGTGDPVLFPGDTSIGVGAAFSPDSAHIVIPSTDGTARVWRADGGGNPVVLRGHGDGVTSAAFSHDSTLIATASYDGTARVSRADGSGEPVVLRGHTKMIYSAVFSPDNKRIATASDDGTARVWRADGTSDPVVLRGHTGGVRSALFSSDNTHVVTAGEDGTARVWRADGTGDPVVLRGHFGTVLRAVFSPDNLSVATASADFTARVWQADGSGNLVVLRGHTKEVVRAAFSPDSLRIVTASLDGTARIWRADGTGEPAVLRGHTGEVFNAVFSPDGMRIVTASSDNTARVWRATWPGLLDILRAGTRSCLTIDERERYLGESADDAGRAWKECEAANGRTVK